MNFIIGGIIGFLIGAMGAYIYIAVTGKMK